MKTIAKKKRGVMYVWAKAGRVALTKDFAPKRVAIAGFSEFQFVVHRTINLSLLPEKSRWNVSELLSGTRVGNEMATPELAVAEARRQLKDHGKRKTCQQVKKWSERWQKRAVSP